MLTWLLYPSLLSQLLKRLHKVKTALGKFSHVNKKALQMYEKYSAQRDDIFARFQEMEKSSESIQDLIRNLDKKKDAAIENTFQEVSKHFEQIFEKLVPAGRGRLVMNKRAENAVGSPPSSITQMFCELTSRFSIRMSTTRRSRRAARRSTATPAFRSRFHSTPRATKGSESSSSRAVRRRSLRSLSSSASNAATRHPSTSLTRSTPTSMLSIERRSQVSFLPARLSRLSSLADLPFAWLCRHDPRACGGRPVHHDHFPTRDDPDVRQGLRCLLQQREGQQHPGDLEGQRHAIRRLHASGSLLGPHTALSTSSSSRSTSSSPLSLLGPHVRLHCLYQPHLHFLSLCALYPYLMLSPFAQLRFSVSLARASFDENERKLIPEDPPRSRPAIPSSSPVQIPVPPAANPIPSQARTRSAGRAAPLQPARPGTH